MGGIRILGVVLAVVGVVLLVFAYNAANAPLDQVSNAVTGRFTNETMMYGIFGAAAAVGGVLLAMFGRRA